MSIIVDKSKEKLKKIVFDKTKGGKPKKSFKSGFGSVEYNKPRII